MQRHAPGIFLYKALASEGIVRLLRIKNFYWRGCGGGFFSRDREAGVRKNFFCIAAVEGGEFWLEMGDNPGVGLKQSCFYLHRAHHAAGAI